MTFAVISTGYATNGFPECVQPLSHFLLCRKLADPTFECFKADKNPPQRRCALRSFAHCQRCSVGSSLDQSQ